MNADDLHTAMALIGAHWPGSMTAVELDAWRRNLRSLDLDQLVETLDGLAASGCYPRYRPTIGIVLETYRAKSRRKVHLPEQPLPAPLPREVTRGYLATARAALANAGVNK